MAGHYADDPTTADRMRSPHGHHSSHFEMTLAEVDLRDDGSLDQPCANPLAGADKKGAQMRHGPHHC
jgi:hypothetical protein